MPSGWCDVVIVGSGVAGLSCAIAAQELGLDCVVLEKAARLGGGSAVSGGAIWVGANHLYAASGGSDTFDEVVSYLRYVGADGLNEDKMSAFANRAPEALRFFAACGVPFQLTPRIDHYYGVAPGAKNGGRIVEAVPAAEHIFGACPHPVAFPAGRLFRLDGNEMAKLGGANSLEAWHEATRPERVQADIRAGGAGLVSWLASLAIARGITIQVNMPVKRLVFENGHVSGAVTEDGAVIVARRGVVLACGGYESNPRLVDNFESLPGWQSMFPETISGDGLVMAGEIGAAVRMIANNLAVFLGFRNPDEAPDGTALCRLSSTNELSSRHTIVVNSAGLRFADETFFQAMAPSLRLFDVRRRELQNLPCYLIFDDQYRRSHSFAGRPPGAEIPSWVARGATISELAMALGVDPDGLRSTVERFNNDVRGGCDSAHHRGENPWGLSRFSPRTTLGTIEEPPFCGIELHPTALASAGLDTDQCARVQHVRGSVIHGLYAIGNAAARTETGSGYQTGFSLGSALTFGLIAARDMARAAQGQKS